MKKTRTRPVMFLVTILTALALSALQVVPVFADDEAPPPPAATEAPPPKERSAPEAPPAESPLGQEIPAAVAELAGSTEEMSPAAEFPATQEVLEKDPGPAEETPEEILAQIPEETELVVADESGKILPLAAQEAAETIAAIDPVWCPAGVTPQDGTGGCSDGYTSLYALVTDLMNGTIGPFAANGVIWIQAGTDISASPIVLDGSDTDLGNLENYSLTLKGGWSGYGSTATSSLTPSTLNVPLSIINWKGSITLSDILIEDIAAGGTAALTVATTKNISLTRVEVGRSGHPNAGSGAALINSLGTGKVTITNSRFSYNTGGAGLQVVSGGTITASGLSANNNGSVGASFINTPATTPKNVTLTSGTFEFNDNGAIGLEINSKGALTLKNITANGNDMYGTMLNNTGGSGAVTLSGTNIFSMNTNGGLHVTTRGKITISNLIASLNASGFGASLNNAVGDPTAASVTLTGTSRFESNAAGLNITSTGTIALNNIFAIGNSGYGAVLFNNLSVVGSMVKLTGTNLFQGNSNTGLIILSQGAVSLNNITAGGNGSLATPGFGARIDNKAASSAKAVILTGANKFNGNYGGGLHIESRGKISLSKVTAEDNAHDSGLWLENSFSLPASPQNVTLLGYVTANRNGSDGLHVQTFGSITLSNVTTNGNGTLGVVDPGLGAVLDNCIESVGACTAITPKAVILTGIHTFSDNYTGGLYIASLGAVTLNKINANTNNGFGVQVNNGWNPLVPQNVTMNGYGNFNGNGSSGFSLSTYGTIALSNLHAESNGGTGITLNNSSGSLARGVTISGYAETLNNAGDGLTVYSRGAIKVTNLNATGNAIGALLQNLAGDSASPVTILGHVWANDNTSYGLGVVSLGAISIANLSAWNNGHGVGLDNSSSAFGTVTITGSASLGGNTAGGLVIASRHAITISNLTSEGNGGIGAALLNFYSGSGSPQNVTILGYGRFNGNGNDGLNIFTYGVITLNNLTANDNTGYGVNLDNYRSDGVTPKAIKLNGTNTFNHNTLSGLRIASLGTISASNLTANTNGVSGAYLDNCQFFASCRGAGALTLSGVNTFIGNVEDGLYFDVAGAVNLARITADDNGDDGVEGLGENNITLTCGSMVGNTDTGWKLNAWGSAHNLVTLKGVSAYGNATNTYLVQGMYMYARTCPLP